MSRPKKSYKQRLQLLKKFAKRLSAYSAAAAATVVSMHSTANAEEKVWDILDIVSDSANNTRFNMTSGGVVADPTTANGYQFNNTAEGSFGFGYGGILFYAPVGDTLGGVANPAFVIGAATTNGDQYDVYASSLAASDNISGTLIFGGRNDWAVYGYGNFVYNSGVAGPGGVLGVQFQIAGQLHYGWAQITAAENGTTLHGFGYNKVAGAASHAVDTVDVPGDINRDGVLNDADWIDFIAGNQTDLDGLTREEAYGKGDIDGDFDSDIRDYDLFRKAYDDANGAGAFAAMAASVPEPSSIMLLAFGAAGLAAWRRRRED